MITPKDNILLAYNRQEPYWVPSHYLDQNTCVYRANREGAQGFGLTKDCFGVQWTYNKGDEGPMVAPGTKLVDDIEQWKDKVKFPNCSLWEWEKIAREDTKDWDRNNKISSVIIINGLFEQLHVFTGMEDALVYLLTNPQEVDELLSCIAAQRVQQIELIKKYYQPDKIQFHDDYGDNQNTLMSPELWRDLIKPHLSTIVKATKRLGMLFELHSDGFISTLIEDFIEIGIDALNPLQICNNPYELKKKYGKKLCFVGGFDNQGILDKPDSTYEEQYKELFERISLMAPGGSWVAHPVMLNPELGLVLTDALYEYNSELMEKAGYVPPPKPLSVKKNAYKVGYEH